MDTNPTLPAPPDPETRGSGSGSTRIIPPEIESALPSQKYGKFVRTTRLGAGGMGEVWKAWDTALNRWVALKFLKDEDQAEIERFVREAQTAGKLAHPNIAAIYEAGQVPIPGTPDQRWFIAMQFIDGATLRGQTPDARRAAEWVRDAARAVHFAHEQGVIHRDLKPENLMTMGNRIFVMDFGLARHVEKGSQLSVSGSVVGTPSYMPPEQARGARADARSDVYGLGATLYALLSGRPPVDGSNVYDIISRVQTVEPAPLSGDADLRTIVTKCLEKDPARRYPTAAAVADDLDHFLNHEPISARPASILYRLRKGVVRRRGLVAVIGASLALIALVALALVWIGGRSERERRQLVDDMRSASETRLAAMLDLRRLDNAAGMEKYAAEVDVACRRVLEAIPNSPEAHYRMGRVRRALMKDDEALAAQKLAGEYGPARYERLVLTSRRYAARVERLVEESRRAEGQRMAAAGGGEVRGGTGRPLPSGRELAATDAEAAALMAEMLADLAALGGVSETEQRCAQGIKARFAGELDEARRLLAASLDLEEAVETLATLEFELDRFGESAKVWAAGRARDRGYVPFLKGHGRALMNVGLAKMEKREDPAEAFREAGAVFEAWARRDPVAEAHRLYGASRLNWANWLRGTGGDPSEHYGRALAAFDAALAKDARSAAALWGRGIARTNFGVWLMDRGRDPKEQFEAATADLEASLAIDPVPDDAWHSLGLAWMNWAIWRERRGEDPFPAMTSALDAFGRGLERHPKREDGWIWRGRAHLNMGIWEQRRGRPAKPHLKRAMDDFEEALRLPGRRDEALLGRGGVQRSMALAAANAGENAEPHFAKALEDFAEVARLAPARDDPWGEAGFTRFYLAQTRRLRGKDPTATYREAIADYGKAIERGPKIGETWWRRGEAKLELAVAVSAKDDPSDLYRDAIADFDHALTLTENADVPWVRRGEARLNWAIWAGQKGDANALYEAAVSDLTAAIQRNPGRADVWQFRGRARSNWAMHRIIWRNDPGDLWERAFEDLEKAVSIDATDVAILWAAASARYMRAETLAMEGKPAAEHYRKALGHFDAMIALDKANQGRVADFAAKAKAYLNKHGEE